nr:MAG TPA: hypothetical protein [Caudoviricetes sp.]
MADRAIRPTRIKTSHQPTVQQKQTKSGMFSRTSTFTMSAGGNHN